MAVQGETAQTEHQQTGLKKSTTGAFGMTSWSSQLRHP